MEEKEDPCGGREEGQVMEGKEEEGDILPEGRQRMCPPEACLGSSVPAEDLI